MTVGNDATFENLVDDFSRVEQDENKNEDVEIEEAKGDKLIKDVIEGWKDNFEDISFENSVEVMDMLDSKVRDGVWGKKVKELWDNDDAFRVKLEKGILALVKKLGGLGESIEEAKEEDVYVGAQVTILLGGHKGERGEVTDFTLEGEEKDFDEEGGQIDVKLTSGQMVYVPIHAIRVEEAKVEIQFSPDGTLLDHTIAEFRKVENDLNKNVDEGKKDITPVQCVTPFEKMLESCQQVKESSDLEAVEEVVKEGKDNPGVRDGTGPPKDSAQKSVSDKGRRKAAGEECPNESEVEEVVKEGLQDRSDNAIYVQQDNFIDAWQVIRTRADSNQSTVMFTFDTSEEAAEAGEKIAVAIGGTFHGDKDPRSSRSDVTSEEASVEEEVPAEEEDNTDISSESNWFEFAEKYDFTQSELNVFAQRMGFADFKDMEDETPGGLRSKDFEKFEDVLSDFVGSAEESVKEEVDEGKDNPGVRDGTGPPKDSAQRSISKIGKRKAAGEECPNESEVKEEVVEEGEWKLSRLELRDLRKAFDAQNELMGVGLHDTQLMKELEDAIAKKEEN